MVVKSTDRINQRDLAANQVWFKYSKKGISRTAKKARLAQLARAVAF